MTDGLRLLRLTPEFDWRLIDPSWDDEGSVGGLATQASLQTIGVAQRGVVQEVVTRVLPRVPQRAVIQPTGTISAVGRADAVGVHRRNLAWLRGAISLLVRRRRDPPDLVHVHASGIFEPLLAALSARFILGRPVVLTLHCSAIATYVPVSWRDQVVQVFTRALERAAVRASTRTITLTRRAAMRFPGSAEAMPDWVRIDQLAPGPQRAQASLRFAAAHDLPPDRPVAIFLGRVSAEKGWPALVRLAQRLADIHLHVLVCGDGPDLGVLRRQVEDLGITEAFTFTGAISAEDVPAALGCASLIVLPSTHEELGSVLLEAMAAGVPSVAYDAGGTSEAIEPDVTGLLVRSGDEPALVEAVRHTLLDGELQARARTQGPELARDRYAIGAGADRLTQLYREVCGYR